MCVCVCLQMRALSYIILLASAAQQLYSRGYCVQTVLPLYLPTFLPTTFLPTFLPLYLPIFLYDKRSSVFSMMDRR